MAGGAATAGPGGRGGARRRVRLRGARGEDAGRRRVPGHRGGPQRRAGRAGQAAGARRGLPAGRRDHGDVPRRLVRRGRLPVLARSHAAGRPAGAAAAGRGVAAAGRVAAGGHRRAGLDRHRARLARRACGDVGGVTPTRRPTGPGWRRPDWWSPGRSTSRKAAAGTRCSGPASRNGTAARRDRRPAGPAAPAPAGRGRVRRGSAGATGRGPTSPRAARRSGRS